MRVLPNPPPAETWPAKGVGLGAAAGVDAAFASVGAAAGTGDPCAATPGCAAGAAAGVAGPPGAGAATTGGAVGGTGLGVGARVGAGDGVGAGTGVFVGTRLADAGNVGGTSVGGGLGDDTAATAPGVLTLIVTWLLGRLA